MGKDFKLAFSQKGLKGYKFILKNKNLEVYFLNVIKGHDTYFKSKKCSHIYYILKGKGFFDVNNKKINVKTGNIVEISPRKEYTYTGKMEMLLIINPPWFKGNEIILRKNPAV